MDNYDTHYWGLRLDDCEKALTKNNFEVFRADNAADAGRLVLETILPATGAKTLSWGGSVTLGALGIPDAVKNDSQYEALDPYPKNASPEEMIAIRRQALQVDCYMLSANAVTLTGKLVNLDMVGNRVGALTFGPKNVIVIAGRNKLVADIEDALFRVKDRAAPPNAMRLDKKTPCTKTGFCEDCSSPDRICNTWTITEKSFPKKRIKVVLVNEDLGL
ncbi:lactate utilization protein [Oceanidesulfovibrio marinus]|uniref:Lactate utilization protein n=1 Tax=Oceanidesulfovibrio marinus TaxID=370038 RepID=A0ABX6NFD5_9BACT|nr:lactate utilization protein [Oceanidesulfovibrio marinus]QJT08305.1 lactate utilization protein [Oceanidesulfovibrio marinus]